LFDTGYITITKEHKIEVSRTPPLTPSPLKRKGEGVHQYRRGELSVLPIRNEDKPLEESVDWQNVNQNIND
jgi:hypothetical protein